MSIRDDSFSDEYYHDDIQESSPRKSKGILKLKLALLSVVTVFGYTTLGSTFASNIQLGSGRVEFGQGVLVSTACDSSITVTPFATFANAAGNSAAYKLTDIQVTGIDSGCYGKDLVIKAFDSLTAIALNLYQTGGSTMYDSIRVYNNGGTFTLAGAGLTNSDINAVTGGFRVSLFNSASPASVAQALATSVYRVTIETVEHDSSLTQSSSPSGSLTFNGSTTDISYNANSGFVLGTSDFTIDVLANVSSTSSNQTFYDAGGDINSNNGFAFWIEGDTLKIRANFGVVADMTYSMQSGWRNSWHHYAAVRGNGKFRVFVDGTKVIEGIDTGFNIDRNAPVIGQLNNFRNNYAFKGSIRNLRVVKGSSLYSSNFSAPVSPLSKVSGTLLLLLAQNPANPTYDSSDNHWAPKISSTLPTYVAP